MLERGGINMVDEKNMTDVKTSVREFVSERTSFSVSDGGIKALANINEAERGKTVSIADMNLFEENFQRSEKKEDPRMVMDERDIFRANSERDLFPDFTDNDAHEEVVPQDSIASSDGPSSDEESYENIDPDPEGDDYSEEA